LGGTPSTAGRVAAHTTSQENTVAQVSRHCKDCGVRTLHVKEQLSNGMGCLLTVVTLGLFIPFWIVYGLFILPFRPYRCQVCGRGRLT